MTPTLYVKTGCPYCKAATDYLDGNKIEYKTVDVSVDEAGMKKLQEISGQTKTPTIDYDGEVLADFGVEQLEDFIAQRAQK
ncbi:MAG: glutathione S-transferase N-terminal domain-containing protein [Verrucomicrobiota bacterium]|nr:glutathione S-transferase N-terminal domain-containing protein [Verrucomicrobiota bacterium]